MKERISITLDKETVKILNSLLEDEKFRNRSHLIEFLIKQFEKDKKKGNE